MIKKAEQEQKRKAREGREENCKGKGEKEKNQRRDDSRIWKLKKKANGRDGRRAKQVKGKETAR